jgi:hypothetical protein
MGVCSPWTTWKEMSCSQKKKKREKGKGKKMSSIDTSDGHGQMRDCVRVLVWEKRLLFIIFESES